MRISFELDTDLTINLNSNPSVFKPNATTKLLINAVESKVKTKSKILDLGCGTGVVGIALCEKNLVKEPLYASDLSIEATDCSKTNFSEYGCIADVRTGSVFEPWQGEKFDIIVDDVSGIAKEVADVSPWFPGVPCDTGEDGTNLILDIISNADSYLNSDGLLFFPVLSLSNVDLILQIAESKFALVEKIQRTEWPLPTELREHIPLLRHLYSKNLIKFEERFGMVVCFTEVYCASQPR